jgi:pimeloyl-ACP methyl ester carboxylesterase
VWADFDQGTQRAILRLYRTATARARAAAGAELQALQMPALLVWGERDPWLPAAIGAGYASRLHQAALVSLPNAGHWPWFEDPQLVDRVLAFVKP